MLLLRKDCGVMNSMMMSIYVVIVVDVRVYVRGKGEI